MPYDIDTIKKFRNNAFKEYDLIPGRDNVNVLLKVIDKTLLPNLLSKIFKVKTIKFIIGNLLLNSGDYSQIYLEPPYKKFSIAPYESLNFFNINIKKDKMYIKTCDSYKTECDISYLFSYNGIIQDRFNMFIKCLNRYNAISKKIKLFYELKRSDNTIIGHYTANIVSEYLNHLIEYRYIPNLKTQKTTSVQKLDPSLQIVRKDDYTYVNNMLDDINQIFESIKDDVELLSNDIKHLNKKYDIENKLLYS